MNKLRIQFFLGLCCLLLSGYATVFAHAYEENIVQLTFQEPVVTESTQEPDILFVERDSSGNAKENGSHEPLTIEEEQLETESDSDFFDSDDLLGLGLFTAPLFTRIPDFSFHNYWKPLSAETTVSRLFPNRPIYLILRVFRI